MSMSHRVPALELADLGPHQQALVEEWSADRHQTAPPSEIWRVLLRSPGGFRVLGKAGAFVRAGTELPHELRVVASFAASVQRGYAFEIETQRRNLIRAGWSEADIINLSRRELDTRGGDAILVAALAFAVADRAPAVGDLVGRARTQLSDQMVTEVVIVSAYFCMLADMARTLVGEGSHVP
jgi:Carboxymuconolactone decarboxylase family